MADMKVAVGSGGKKSADFLYLPGRRVVRNDIENKTEGLSVSGSCDDQRYRGGTHPQKLSRERGPR